MKKKRHSGRTLLLATVVGLLLAANIWWFLLRAPAPATPAFELGSTDGLQVGVTTSDAAAAPVFDPVHDRWTAGGGTLTGLHGLIRRSVGTDTAPAVDFLIVRLARDTNSEQARRALLSLVRQRICFVAIVDDVQTPDGSNTAAPVHRIVSVRGNDGMVVGCSPPQRPTAASSATI